MSALLHTGIGRLPLETREFGRWMAVLCKVLSAAAASLRNGARVPDVIMMLSAWACIKLPQELMEWQFLGARFVLTRLVLTMLLVVPMGLAIERLIDWDTLRELRSDG